MQTPSGGSNTELHDLLLAVAEQLKVPLTVIARQAELSQLRGQAALVDAVQMHTQAAAALQLVDSYLLGLELARGQTELLLEPVSVSSMLVDAAHSLERFARQYGVGVELHIGGRYEPVMANSRGLRAALASLGFALAESIGAQQQSGARVLTLAVHRTARGVTAGMYGCTRGDLTAEQWRRALGLSGRAGQPLTGMSAGSGAGFFVADTILRSMQTRLKVGHYVRQGGLAATFQPSQQLQFV